jgi:hypothetical protein
MAFVVEDGTGTDPLANSYSSVQEWKDYWVDVGYDFSAYSDPQIRAALVAGTRYLEQLYRNDWYGLPLMYDQPLAWPRDGVYVNCVLLEGIPTQLKNALHELARRALPGTQLLPDPADTDRTGQQVARKRVKAGPIETDITYGRAGARLMPRYPAVEKWLTDLKASGGGSIRA